MKRVCGLVLIACLTFVPLTARANPVPIGQGDGYGGDVTTELLLDGAQVEANTPGRPGNRQPRSVGQAGGTHTSESGSSSASSAAARAAAAAAFAACEARGQAAVDAGGAAAICGFIPAAAGGGAPGAPGAPTAPAIDPGVLARQALLRLPIPMPQAQIGPAPSINEWNMAAVGYPLWLWTDDPNTHTMTVTEEGITLTLQATRRTTRFDLGDGTRMFCGVTTPWHGGIRPGTPSPSCGHIYQQPSSPGGTYAVTATTVWDISWSALGQTGTLDFERTGPATPLPVGELHALRTG